MLGLLRHLASELDLDRLLRRIIAQTTETLGAERSTLFLVDYEKDQLWSRVAKGRAALERAAALSWSEAAARTAELLVTGERST